MARDLGVPTRSLHPSVFLFLLLPYGVTSGYVTVTLGKLLANAGVSTEAIATLIAISLLPQTWKVLWAPLIDATLTRKRWYWMAAIVTGVGMAGTGFVSADAEGLELVTILVFGFNVAASFQCMAAESLMAHATPDHLKGRTGGWCQAGNLGGQGLGGGAGLWLADHLDAPWTASVTLGAVCILCSVALLFLDEPVAETRALRLIDDLKSVALDVLGIVRTRLGLLALFLLFLPIGSGAAQNLWSAIAGDWRAGDTTVELVNGAGSGLVSAIGCLIGGALCDRIDRKMGYAVFGVVLAVVAVAMAAAPRTEAMFVIFSSLYNLVLGFCYAAFTAVALEAIGRGAAATKYNLMACASNVPIAYVTLIDGWAQTRWGSGWMLVIEAGVGIAGILVFWGFAKVIDLFLPRDRAPVLAL